MPKRFVLAEEFTDPQLERELLAAIAANPELYWELLDLLVPEAMTETRPAFEELAAAVEQEKPLPAIEGQPTPNPVAAAKQLADLYQKRLLAELAQDFLQKLRTEVSATELITSLEERLAQVQRVAKEMRVGQVLSLPELLPDLLADVAARHEALKTKGKAVVGLPSGITKLDKLLGGFQPGLHLLAAEPGKGKTTFTLQVSAHVARAGFPVLFISFEEVLARLALKVICARAGLEAKKFGDGYGDPGELQRAAREYGRELACLHFVEGTARLTVPQLRAKALQIMNRWKKQRCLVVVDYLQRWAASRREYSEFRHVVSGLVSELRELALRLNSPIIVISSQNRPGQGTASLTSLKESGDLEYSADTAIFLVDTDKRQVTPPARAIDLTVEKNRFGDKGRVELVFRADIGVFREVARA